MHPAARGAPMPSQYDYPGAQAGYPHPHHPSAQSQNQQQQQGPPSQHHSHQQWNDNAPGHLPSVLQPQSLATTSSHPSVRGPGAALPPAPPALPFDRSYAAAPQRPDDDMDDDDTGGYDDYDSKGKARAGDGAQSANKGTSDFVKKLFSMLDDKAYESVVAWSPSGESFIVKDMNDFTKHVLPRNFRHSNFASFVRQLNKYDFHKVKNPEDGSASVGEHIWEFQHPDFVRGREDLLENVKRKIPAKKKPNLKAGLADADRDDSPSMPLPAMDVQEKTGESYADLRAQVIHLTSVQDQMQNHILALTKQYQGVIGEMLTFQRNMVQQDQLMQNLIQYLMNLEHDRNNDPASGATSASALMAQTGTNAATSAPNAFLPSGAPGSYGGGPYASDAHVDSSNARDGFRSAVIGPHSVGSSVPSAENSSSATIAGSSTRMSGMATAPSTVAPLSPKSVASPMDSGRTPESSQSLMHPPRHEDMARRNSSLSSLRMLNGAAPPDPANSGNGAGAGGSSNTMPKLESRSTSNESRKAMDRTPSRPASSDPGKNDTVTNASGSDTNQQLRPRRPTLVPGWTAPPRVLLVDDDEVCRRLSSKFLQVFGCSIDYAVDGMSAVNKMNQERYDLVLMDIVMPNLDGMSATSLIRQFDPSTPIISMTSNSGPSELMNYMSSGMTDFLPKPFTKEGLLNMLEKHLLHLKAAQREHRAASTDQGGGGASGGPGQMSSGGAMGTGDGAGGIKRSSSPLAPLNNIGSSATPSNGAADDDGVNPLAGMGFTDEEYVAMLQNLIAAGTGDDELASALFGNDTFASQDNTPRNGGDMGHTPNHVNGNANRNSPYAGTTPGGPAGFKRSASDERSGHGGGLYQQQLAQGGDANKRGRFGEGS
ncbi:DNA binding transcription factor [Pseudozyma hubeiensis SY62]|uniref:DNA binding transcription factor n=1 Tax=Pseudozyma hubeiensis (strain SY62) TaxID=1305764 RepID=R9PD80_PSEHS|nr:DNA binding transcription factor [Pseudozyma hubeiensis SY62]GAC99217.1 DNA binding transcription factor [Pseudozyma hubeiensis SY62]